MQHKGAQDQNQCAYLDVGEELTCHSEFICLSIEVRIFLTRIRNANQHRTATPQMNVKSPRIFCTIINSLNKYVNNKWYNGGFQRNRIQQVLK